LFPKLKLRVKGYNFRKLDSVQKDVTNAIKTLTDVDFQSCREERKFCWAKCIASEGCYFEGDNANVEE
jgi:hypothetical protein